MAPGDSPYTGFSNGTLEFVNALNVKPDALRVGLGQAAAGVQLPGPLGTAATFDQLKQPLLIASKAGKTAYGHSAGVNVGLLSANASVPPQFSRTLVEATSPAPSSGSSELLDVAVSPVATGRVLPGDAVANTTADGACVLNKDTSSGTASITNAKALIVSPTTQVAVIDDVSETFSHERLVPVAGNTGLLSETIQQLAPVTLFKGTPAELTIKVLAPLHLSAVVGGAPGSAKITYGSGLNANAPILMISGGGQSRTLTSTELFGNGGVVLPLGAIDVTIGAPAHSLTGLERTPVTQSADGTLASAAVDFIRISVPGRLNTPGQNPIDGPLAGLNAVLNPVLTALDPLLSGIQDGLKNAGLDLADVRVGHMEVYAQVPDGGIQCDNPLDESFKDVTATSVVAGQTFNYLIRVPNRGTSPITNVTVEDTYSAALKFVSSVPAPVSHVGNVLKFNLGTLEPNEVATIVMTFRVPANATPGTVYRNSAIIRGTYNGQPISFPVQVNGPTVVGTLTGNCNLSGAKKYASNTHVFKGENFGYFINVFNSGGTDCKNVVVKDKLIGGVSFVSCTRSCIRSGQNLTWKLGTIQSGQSLVLGVIVKVTASSGRLPNKAIITTSNGTGAKPSTPGPIVGAKSIPRPGDPAILVRDDGDQLPRTGMSTGVAVLGMLLLLGGAVAYRRRRPGTIG